MVRLTLKHSTPTGGGRRVRVGGPFAPRFGDGSLVQTRRLARINDLHIRQLTLKFEQLVAPAIRRCSRLTWKNSRRTRVGSARLTVDVDPVNERPFA